MDIDADDNRLPSISVGAEQIFNKLSLWQRVLAASVIDCLRTPESTTIFLAVVPNEF